jgi:predicted Zn finger-like uncharacterized protein
MKIVCDNCATKYQIADEKVSGKAFKIRCKKCGHVIVVGKNADGTASSPAAGDAPAEAPAPAPEPAASDSVWHLVIEREQVGPMTAEEVRGKVKAGQVDGETYGWKEGFEDWLKLSAIDDFKELFAGKPAEQATKRLDPAEQQRAATPVAATPGADLMAANEPVKTAAPTAATLYSENGADARAALAAATAQREAQQAAQQAAQQQAAQQQAAQAPVDGGGMTGARSENSVLFSLNNLSALAGGGGGGGSGASAPASKQGYASGQSEASGLIDIRAMAAQHLGGPMSGANASRAPDLFGGGDGGAVFAPVAPAVLVPTAPSEGVPKWVWALVGVGGVSIVGLIIFLVVFLSGSPQQPVANGGPAAGANSAGTTGAVTPGTTPPAGTTVGTAATPDKPTAGKTEPATKPETTAKDSGSGSKASGKPSKGSKSTATSAPKETAPPPEKAGPGKAPDEAPPPPKKAAEKPKAAKDDLDSLLDTASSGSGGKPQKAEKKDLPESLDRGTIMSTLKGANFAPCKAEGASGVISVKLTIGKNGKVSDASGPNDCVVKVIKGVKFPEFSGDPMSLTYPALIR